MRRFRIRLSLKVTIIVTAFLTVTFVIVTPLIVNTITNQAKQSLIDGTKSFTLLATQPIGEAFLRYRDAGTTIMNERITSIAKLNTSVTNIAIYDVGGTKQYNIKSTAPALTQDEASIFKPDFRFDAKGFVKQVIYPFIEENGAHRYTIDYEISSVEIMTELSAITNGIYLTAFFVLIITDIIILLLLERLFIRPLKTISRLALATGAGQYSIQIPIKRNDEIGDVATSINSMASMLHSDIDKLREA
jgi:HAMP domain-containing protein